MKERTTGVKSVLRIFGFGLLAVVIAMTILAVGCSVLFGLSAALMESGYPYEEYPYQPSAPPQWTPDSRWIVFAYRGTIYSVDADGTSLRLIHRGEGEEDLRYSPDVSPDGSKIVYLKNHRRWPWESRHFEIATSALDGTDERVLTDLNDRYGLGNPSWSPDGSRIAFVGGDKIYTMAIYTMAVDGSDLHEISGLVDRPIITDFFSGGTGSPLIWSPDGLRIAFVADDYTRELDEQLIIQTIGVDGGGPKEIGQGHSVPAWSPDGAQLAFVEMPWEEDEQFLQIYVASRDAPGIREIANLQVPTKLYLDVAISWSPDGSEILVGPFVAKVGDSTLRLLPAPDTVTTTVDASHLYGLTSWSPDGSRIAIQMNHNRHHPSTVYTVSRDGSDNKVLVERHENGNLSAAGGRSLWDDKSTIRIPLDRGSS